LGFAAVLPALLLAACPEPAPPGFDPSNPQPLDPSLRRAPPPGATRPDEPTPPPRPRTVDLGDPVPPPKGPPPAPPPDAPPSKEDLAAKFTVHFGGSGHASQVWVEGDAKAATVREVKLVKEDAALKTDQLTGKEVAAFLAALDKLEWWKFESGSGAPVDKLITLTRGNTSRSFSTACAKGKTCANASAEALIKGLAAKTKAVPETKVLKFKPGATAKGAPVPGHCPLHERPGFTSCAIETGMNDHCTGKGKKFVCFATPFDPKGVAVTSDVAVDEKKKAAAPQQPWAIELAADHCVSTIGNWRCEHDTSVSRVSTGKTWLAWPNDGPPVAVKSGYAE
jgi:hypothetical protein